MAHYKLEGKQSGEGLDEPGCVWLEMAIGCWKYGLVLLVFVASNAAGSLHMHIVDFIKVVKQIEDEGPLSEPLAVLQTLRSAAGLNDVFIKKFLGDAGGHVLDAALSAYIRMAVHHSLSDNGTETGVVLTTDGTTVALMPVLLDIEAGFRSASRGSVRGLFELAFTKNLEFRSPPPTTLLGSDGCWDNVTSPSVFTLSESPSFLTNAQLNGGMDGVLLGTEATFGRHEKLSGLLTGYYCHRLDSGGLDTAPRLISQRRRENFRGLVSAPEMVRKVLKSLELQRRLTGRLKLGPKTKKKLRATVERGVQVFSHMYMVCPSIIPRCQWEAKPYRGTPTNLSLPLSHLFIHHTFTPSQPCLTFQQCSADMRSMQRFHQEDRGWDDIGYSFVAGSDGNLYEGRGWHRQGAHTLGHNTIGYGVSFIGDYTSCLPSQHSMGLVRDNLAKCAVGGGRLEANFTLQGHRQVVATSCPGDTFYNEIKSWEHFTVN